MAERKRTNNTHAGKSEMELKRIRNRILIVFCLIVIVVTGFMAVVILNLSSNAIRQNASRLIMANSRQLQLNINTYIDNVETTAALLFSDENYYKYDATSDSIDEYTKLQHESAILDRIVDLGIMENFSDFGIIYADNQTVGWISNTTKGLVESGEMYNVFSGFISDENTRDGWFFGLSDNYDRLFYVKRLNGNAILLASIYNRELATVFEFPQELKGMIIRLIDEQGQILYSSEKKEIGSFLQEGMAKLVEGKSSYTYAGDEYILNVNSCENGWRVLCVIPNGFILSDIDALTAFTVSFSLVLAAVFVLIGLYVFNRFTKPMDTVVSNLEQKAYHDGLSGLYNKVSFELMVRTDLDVLPVGRTVVMTIIDVDHFKSINDSFGHEYGDKVIERTAKVLKENFNSYITIGRIGGDEFALYHTAENYDLEQMKTVVETTLTKLQEAFKTEFEEERKSVDLSLSIGVIIFSFDGEDFNDMYKMADAALYVSKEGGRNRFTLYEEGMRHE